MTRVHVVLRGRVQGVGFRYFVRQLARRHDLSGWVRNRPDGSVEVAASGEAASIVSLRAALAIGPDGAIVQSIEPLDLLDEELPNPFAILR